MARFTVLRNDRVERSLTLLGEEVAIGRASGADLELPQPSVSRRHARIRRDSSVFVLEDLGSVNGILIDGTRVRRHVLRPGDRFRIEDFEIVFEPPDELYEQGLQRERGPEAGPQAFSMTFLSAGGFTAPPREKD